MCKVYRGRRRQAANEFRFEDIELECVGVFAYLDDILNDAGEVEQAVAGQRG